MSDHGLQSGHIGTAFLLNAVAALATVSPHASPSHPDGAGYHAQHLGRSHDLPVHVLSFGYSVLEFTQAFEPEHLDGYNSLSGSPGGSNDLSRKWNYGRVRRGLHRTEAHTEYWSRDTQADKHQQRNERIRARKHSGQCVAGIAREQGFVKMDEAAKEKLQRMGILSGIAIALHNIPAGIATFTAGIEDPAIGLSMAIGVGLHNIAEGVAVAAPVYFATGSKWKGIMCCHREHVGGFIALAIIGKDDNDFAEATLYGVVAGMMATITMKEVFPTAYTYANGRIHLVSNGGLMGMILMALSLYFFKYLGVGK
ncbi:Zinc/iron permease [Phytophthora cactorum]|nr:Zinc/iron permease [Phytophthora cactorum]